MAETPRLPLFKSAGANRLTLIARAVPLGACQGDHDGGGGVGGNFTAEPTTKRNPRQRQGFQKRFSGVFPCFHPMRRFFLTDKN